MASSAGFGKAGHGGVPHACRPPLFFAALSFASSTSPVFGSQTRPVLGTGWNQQGGTPHVFTSTSADLFMRWRSRVGSTMCRYTCAHTQRLDWSNPLPDGLADTLLSQASRGMPQHVPGLARASRFWGAAMSAADPSAAPCETVVKADPHSRTAVVQFGQSNLYCDRGYLEVLKIRSNGLYSAAYGITPPQCHCL